MKYTFRTPLSTLHSPLSVLLILIFLASCAKDDDALLDGKIFITTENHLSPAKTSVSGKTVKWVGNKDTIRLYIGDYEENRPVLVSDGNAYVKGYESKRGTGVVRAFYPYTIVGNAAGATDAPTVTIPSRYYSYYNSDDRQVLALPMVAKAPNGATTVEFKHLTAALMVNLKNETTFELTLDSIVVSSRQYLLSGTMELNLNNAEGFGVVAQTTTDSDSNAVSVRFSGITLGASQSDIETLQIPIRPIGASNLRIEVYAHCQGDAIGESGAPTVYKTVVYHYNNTNSSPAIGRNVMMAAGIVLSNGGHTTPEIIDNSIFSVSSSKKVRFSQGNLRFNNSSYTFHTKQYDRVGTNQTESDKDLFPWATAVATTVSGWNILSAEEWSYLINDRPGNRFIKACVNNVNGLIIFPDTYRHPIVQKLNNVNAKETSYSANEFTIDQWQSMEAAGAIFLPAAGCHNGTSVVSFGGEGDYWSSTEEENDKAKRLEFQSDEVTTDNGINRSNKCSVRLVKVVPTNPVTVTGK